MGRVRALDEKDHELVRLLQENAWITHAQAGEKVHLSASAVQRRINRLRAEGIITGARVTVDRSLLGQGLRVYLVLELHDDSQKSLRKLVEDLQSGEEVTSVDLVSGKFDVVLIMDCKDTNSFTDFAMSKLNANPNIKHCWTLMRLKQLI